MPDIETSDLLQQAMYWRANGVTGVSGEMKVEAGIEIPVRWEDAYREVIGPSGQKIGLTADVMADRDIKLGSILWLGSLEEWSNTGSGADETELYQVITKEVTPDIRAINTRWKLGLMRYRHSLPTIG
jgi:hypothetical protein